MKKRYVGIFFVIVFFFSILLSRLFFISSSAQSQAITALVGSRIKTVTVTHNRGTIYDRNLEPITNTGTITKAVVDPMLLKNPSILLDAVNVQIREEISKRLSYETPFCVELTSDIEKTDGIYLFEVQKRYADTFPAIHTIGYTDENGIAKTGIELAFDKLLNSNTKLDLSFYVDATRRAISGIEYKTQGSCQEIKEGVVTTLNNTIQKVCDESADTYIESGAIVIIDVKTGQILALSSRPSFSPLQLSQVDSSSGAFINRCFSAFNVGSVFKIIDTAVYLENGGLWDSKRYCGGSIEAGSNVISCQKTQGHGNINLDAAFSDSCNVFFIKMALELGEDKLLQFTKLFGLGNKTTLCEGIVSKAGNLPTLKNLSADAALANLAIGQGELLATPLQIASIIQTICNDGIRYEPTLIKGFIDKDGQLTQEAQKDGQRIVSEHTAKTIRQLMINTVEYGSGGRAKPDENGAGVKTATAQTGNPDNLNGWIAGFFPAENPKYAVAVLVENALSGAKSAGPAFKYIADRIA